MMFGYSEYSIKIRLLILISIHAFQQPDDKSPKMLVWLSDKNKISVTKTIHKSS